MHRKSVGIAVYLFALSLGAAGCASDWLVGRAAIVDGDTIEVAGKRVRLNGIDAPESWQWCEDATGQTYPCGKLSANALDDFLAKSRPVRCKREDLDRYKRVVGTCFRADGREVNVWMVVQGYALDWPKYSGGRYAEAQRAASFLRRGVWQGRFDEPCNVRAKRANRVPNC
ncbi:MULTISPECIES: thermonuclease family protein [unclassified Shinella]|uniref:thermonuclease family protein n=1 Tax=unclassified Shinella TaxID=2643062 RepID=UPI0009E7A5E5|nr:MULTISPECIES: thermonuclease family protein [unclassified Shinella]